MQSKLVPLRSRGSDGAWRWGDLALEAGLCVQACLYFFLVGCFVLGLYELMQPTRYPNAGMSASTLPSGTGSSVVAQIVEANDDAIRQPSKLSLGGTDGLALASTSEIKANDAAAHPSNGAKQLDRATNTVVLKRSRRTQPKSRDLMMNYPGNSAFGSYLPWSSHQAWGNSRASGAYQDTGRYRNWR
jgi:hypothetical protein